MLAMGSSLSMSKMLPSNGTPGGWGIGAYSCSAILKEVVVIRNSKTDEVEKEGGVLKMTGLVKDIYTLYYIELRGLVAIPK
jgi:hypothetical protein